MNKSIIINAVILAIMICNINISFGADSSNYDEALAYSNKASTRFMKQDIKGALECLDEAIKLSPNNPQLYLNRGFVKHVTRDYASALQDYNKAIEINPNFAFGYNNRGVLKVATGDIDGALADYEKAISLNPKYSDVYYNRGNLRYMLDDNKGALSDYDKAIELNPKDSEAYNNRGVVKKRMDFNVGALSDYSQAIALNPSDSIAYANRGRLKKLYFDNEGAAIDLDQAIALAENQTFIKNVKPLLSNQRYIAAIPVVRSFIPKEPIMQANNVIAEKQPQKITESKSTAIAMLTPSVNVVPEIKQEEKPVQKVVEPAKAKPKQEVKTIESNTKPVKNSVSDSKSTTTLSAGVGKVATPNVPDIRTTAVTKNATTNVKLAESYYIRGLQKCVLHDLNGAISDLDKAIANNSKYADAYYYRAAIKKELGDSEGFRKDYSTAIQINPALQQYNDTNALSLING